MDEAKKLYKNKDWLVGQYINKRRNPYQIAKRYGFGRNTISKWLTMFDIQRRTHGEATHLGNVNHCNITMDLSEVISGQLLSDAYLYTKSQYSAQLSWSQKYEEYVNYLKDTLANLGMEGGEIRKHKSMLIFPFKTYCYKELFPFKNLWYPDGKKIVPKNIKLNPTVCLHWYLGDGSLNHEKEGRSSIKLATCGFPVEDVELLVVKLNELGFKAARHSNNNIIGIRVESTNDFLNYIGSCPVKCYKYKWDLRDNRKNSLIRRHSIAS